MHTVEFRGLEILCDDGFEAWVRLPDRAVLLGRTWSVDDQPQIRAFDGTLAKRHAEIVPLAGGVAVRDLNSTGGTFINDVRQIRGAAPRRLVRGDVIFLGAPSSAAAVTFHEQEPTFACDAVEGELLAAVRARHAGSRAVYADWLEERGDDVRAMFLRHRDGLEQVPANSRESYELTLTYLTELDAVHVGWRFALLCSR